MPTSPPASHSTPTLPPVEISPLATPRAITLRAMLLGLAIVAAVAALTPYNDFVVENTFLIGSYFPPALALVFFVLVVGVNWPLHRFAPRHALSAGELGVIMAMLLAAMGIPTQGLLRGLLPSIVAPFHFGATDPKFWNAFLELKLPAWLFPIRQTPDAWNSPIVQWFYSRTPPGQAPPYGAWLIPLTGWGIFFASMMVSFVTLAAMLLPQWADAERLAFPIAQVQAALIEPPGAGKGLNALFSNRLFWGGLVAVLVLQSLTALHSYFPLVVPDMSLRYDFRASILASPPWNALNGAVRSATVYFTFVGLSYFIPTRMSFSLWAIFLIQELCLMQYRNVTHDDIPITALYDQHLGACVAYLIGIGWIGRNYWKQLLRCAIRPNPRLAGQWRFASPRTLVAAFILSIAAMFGWLAMLGVDWWMILTLLGFVFVGHVITARVVCETGMPTFRAVVSPDQAYGNLPITALSGRDVYFGGMLNISGTYTARESALVFSLHALRVNDPGQDESLISNEARPRSAPSHGLIPLMLLAILTSYIVASGSSLYCYYHYAMPISTHTNSQFINPFAIDTLPRQQLVAPLDAFADKHVAPMAFDPLRHVLFGAGVTMLLQIASLRFAGWPFMPVGYVASISFYSGLAWFSLFLGWLAKSMIVRFGGVKLYQYLKPLFIGLVFGECLAAGIWLLINLLLAWHGVDYQITNFLPN